jgi:CheY-specific phosphatase CheX
MQINQWVNAVIAATLGRTRSYFAEEFGIEVADITQDSGDIATLDICGLTAIVGIGGPVSLLVAFSFDQRLMDILYSRMTEGLEVPSGEEETYRSSVAGEIINTIIGNCTAELQQRDDAITLTPPMILDSVKHIHRMKNAVFISRRLNSEFGSVDINLVGPGELFDRDLNYVE